MKKRLYPALFVTLYTLFSVVLYAQVQENWLKTYNGTDDYNDRPFGLVVDASGNSYVVGLTNNNLSGSILLKYDKDGNLLWTRTFSGRPRAITMDQSQNFVYVTGESSNNYLTVKISAATGNISWGSSYDANGNDDFATAVAVDGSGNVYVTGKSYLADNDDPATADYATIKYNASGTQQWVKRYNGAEPGEGEDGATSIALDASGNIYVTGTSQLNGQLDFATIKYNSAGTEIWVRRYNGPDNKDDLAREVLVDAAGNIIVGGRSETTLIPNNFEYNSLLAIIKYDADGNQVWVNRFSPPGFTTSNYLRDMLADASGNIFIASFHQINAPGTLNTSKLDPNGVVQWVRTNVSPHIEGRGSYIEVDANGDVYITGATFNSMTTESFMTTIKYNTSGTEQWRISTPGRRVGDDAKVGYIGIEGDNVYVSFVYEGGPVNDDDIAIVKYTQCAISIPSVIEVDTEPGICGATVNWGATTTGDCGEIVYQNSSGSVTYTPGSFLNRGHYHMVARSLSTGAEAFFTIRVNDNELPVIECPSNKTVNTDAGVCYATAVSVNAGTATATDNCSVAVTATRSDGLALNANYPVGNTIITWKATDAQSNTVTCSQTITVIDNEPPVISNESASTYVLSPPNHTMRDVTINYSVTDNCAVTSTLSVTSNEPVNGTGDGDTDPDWIVVDNHHVKLRAERAAHGDGRIYTVTITAGDPSGNTSTKTIEIKVPHDIKKPTSGKPFKVGSTVAFEGVFWDKPGNKHTAKWLLDNSTNVKGTVTEPSGNQNGKVTGSYKFNSPGVYKLQMNTTDQTGITHYTTTNGDIEEIIVIYDPNGGYTYGGGWFASPAGALTADPTASGKASFGFAVNYRNAANPKGETQFEFKVGNFEFNALNFDYLVVSGVKAQFKGTGRITGGQSGIAFIMTVIDGELDGTGIDKIRMKIYNKNTNEIIYDNQPGASDADDPVTPVGDNSEIFIQGSSVPPQITNNTNEIISEDVRANSLEVKAYPNPSTNSFSLTVQGDAKEKITMQVIDLYGRIIETRNVIVNSIIQFGDRYTAGTYFVRIVQGKERKEIKLVKL